MLSAHGGLGVGETTCPEVLQPRETNAKVPTSAVPQRTDHLPITWGEGVVGVEVLEPKLKRLGIPI